MGRGMKKTGAAVSMSENELKSACGHVVSGQAAIWRITGDEHHSPKRRMTMREDPLLWTVTRTVS